MGKLVVKSIEILDDSLATVDKAVHTNKLFTRVLQSENDATKIDSSINLSSLFKLNDIDLALLQAIYTMQDTNCRTFDELKTKAGKLLPSGIAMGNKKQGTTVSFYRWKDYATDDRVKKSVMLLAGMFSDVGLHIVLNSSGILSVKRNDKKESLLKAKFYKNVQTVLDGITNTEKIFLIPSCDKEFAECLTNPEKYQKFLNYREIKRIDVKTGKELLNRTETNEIHEAEKFLLQSEITMLRARLDNKPEQEPEVEIKVV